MSGVTKEFVDQSARAAIRALAGLEQTAVMLETYAPEIFPEVNEAGQKHFGRVMMEAAAQSIRDAWKQALRQADLPEGWLPPDIAPTDEWVLLGQAIYGEDEEAPKWWWANGPVHENHLPIAWQHLPAPPLQPHPVEANTDGSEVEF